METIERSNKLVASKLTLFLFNLLYVFYFRSVEHPPWPKKLPYITESTQNPKQKNATHSNSTQNASSRRKPETSHNSTSSPLNMSRQDEDSTTLLITRIMDSIKSLVTTEGVELRKNETELPLCDVPSDLGEKLRF